MEPFDDEIDYKRERILRVVGRYQNGNIFCGSGFFSDTAGHFMTCFHVAFGDELRRIRANQQFMALAGPENIPGCSVGFPRSSLKSQSSCLTDRKS